MNNQKHTPEGVDVLLDLSCDEQFALARRLAANVGYVLKPEASFDDEPDAALSTPPAGDRVRAAARRLLREVMTASQRDELSDYIRDKTIDELVAALAEPRAAEREAVTIPLDVARWVYAAFLPFNPNKLRGKPPALVQAAHAFKAAVEAHGDPRAALQTETDNER